MNSATKKRATSPKPHTPKPSTMNGKPKQTFAEKRYERVLAQTPRKNTKSRSLKGVPIKYALVV